MGADKKLLLEVSDLKVHFSIKSGKAWPWAKPSDLKAVDGVTLRLYEGETLGVVGESGCGKSTFARAIIGLVPATDGKVVWLGDDLTKLDQNALREKRKEIQMIFQDPLASLNPRMTIGDIIAEPLHDEQGGVVAQLGQPLSARVLRRPVPADRDCPGADPRAQDDHLRRAGVGA